MAQFSVYRNPNPATRTAMPLLLDVQTDLLSQLGTRVVVPLCPSAAMKGRIVKTLMPELAIEGKRYVMLTPQLAGVERRAVGGKVADCAAQRDLIIAALDLLVTGI
ncbi:Toxin CcdB [Burkholderiales bacterium]|nr:MAG: plasmid maintenance protein CcdB [Burkholderiales bacterium]CAG0954086.1 Toxin CcdB [Burkholderiales bacterium]